VKDKSIARLRSAFIVPDSPAVGDRDSTFTVKFAEWRGSRRHVVTVTLDDWQIGELVQIARKVAAKRRERAESLRQLLLRNLEGA
jgi:hypothetical protein